MGRRKSERHHWWPECVSKRWADGQGGVHWLRPDSSEQRARPKSFGVIGNGHFVKLRGRDGEDSGWGENFEFEFGDADGRFPGMIDELEALTYDARRDASGSGRLLPQAISERRFGELVECLVSLAIRSPMTRHCAVSLAEQLRGPLEERERNSLIGFNMRHMFRRAVRSLGTRGKATAIYSPDREFIFGDGFYHNLTSPSGAPSSARILAPLTPRLAVLYALPWRYMTEPRLSTLVIAREEADALNDTVQVYARNALFYRSEKPVLTPEFRSGQHRRYTSSGNAVEMIVRDMPGVC
jgi:hypothetical protein